MLGAAAASARDASTVYQPGSYSTSTTPTLTTAAAAATAAATPIWFAAHILDAQAGPLSGCLYEGEVSPPPLPPLPHGLGTIVYGNGLLYEGSFQAGKEHGRGILSDQDDIVLYQGEVADGILTGTGTYYYGNGDRYSGQWHSGLFHGRGRFSTSTTGASYDGEWREGYPEGSGVFSSPSGLTYSGSWRGGYRNGKGELHMSVGTTRRVKGLWNMGILEGTWEWVGVGVGMDRLCVFGDGTWVAATLAEAPTSYGML